MASGLQLHCRRVLRARAIASGTDSGDSSELRQGRKSKPRSPCGAGPFSSKNGRWRGTRGQAVPPQPARVSRWTRGHGLEPIEQARCSRSPADPLVIAAAAPHRNDEIRAEHGVGEQLQAAPITAEATLGADRRQCRTGKGWRRWLQHLCQRCRAM